MDGKHIEMNTDTNNKVAVILTAYNEERNIESVLKEIDKNYWVYVVDDGSSDKTKELALENNRQVVCHPINLGQGAAAVTGYKVAISEGNDIIVKMDADGQHDPKEIPQFIAKMIRENCDVVVGSRRLGTNYPTAPFFRKTFLPFYTWIINKLTGYQMTDAMSGFRAFRASSLKNVAQILDDMIEPQYTASEMFIRFSRSGLQVREVPINLRERISGSSYKGFIRYGLGVLRAIIKTLLDKNYHKLH